MPLNPIVPCFDGVRLATEEDLSRIATVAAAGFFHSPTFQYQRTRHAEFPDDTLMSYWEEYRESISDPRYVVLVAEDLALSDEDARVYDALRGAAGYMPCAGPRSERVVVGVASIHLQEDSRYKGRFQTKVHADGTVPCHGLPNLERDQNPEAVRRYSKATGPAKARHLDGFMRLSTVAVHPAYWRRGHATRLISWCTRLADLEGVPIGISAVPMGATLAARAGFEERELVRVKRRCMHGESDGPDVGGVDLWMAIRRPSGSPASEETGTSSDTPSFDRHP